MKVHRLKLLDTYWHDKMRGLKPWEIRLNDRDYELGDLVEYHRLMPSNMMSTHERMYSQISYVLQDEKYLKDGYCIFSERSISKDTFKILGGTPT
jgi:ParB family chromosome partitioning protein